MTDNKMMVEKLTALKEATSRRATAKLTDWANSGSVRDLGMAEAYDLVEGDLAKLIADLTPVPTLAQVKAAEILDEVRQIRISPPIAAKPDAFDIASMKDSLIDDYDYSMEYVEDLSDADTVAFFNKETAVDPLADSRHPDQPRAQGILPSAPFRPVR